MARKKKSDLETGAEAVQQPQAPEIPPKQRIINEITNLCITIGDKSFLIRQTELELVSYYKQMDSLRIQLGELERANGPQAIK